ncbi:MAG: energy transducer TonB [Thermodesulfobacteriota bacterium]
MLRSGRVGELRVKRSSGHHILDKSALKTVKKWKFIPAKRGEDPIRMWAEIPIKFELE